MMPERRDIIWRAVVVLIGLLALLAAYYWVHKPIDLPLVFSLGGALLDVFAVGLIAAVAGGIGRRLLARLNLDGLSRAERVSLEGLLGLGMLSLGVLALGLAGALLAPVLWAAILGLLLATFSAVRQWLADCVTLAASALRPASVWVRFLRLYLVVLLFVALLCALAPPFAWDALTYHLVGVQRYLSGGQIVAQPDNHFLGMPQNAEMLFALSVGLLGRFTAAAPMHFIYGLFGLFAVAGLARRYADPGSGWLAVVLLLSAHSIWLQFGWPYVDLGVLSYGAATLVAAVRWRETHGVGWLALAGVYGGLALGVKYTAVGLLVALGWYVAIHSPRRLIWNGLTVGLMALLTFLPWMFRGAALYGNPVYPFFGDGLNWDAARSETFSVPRSGLLFSGNGWQLPILPLVATVLGVEKGAGLSFTAGPWLLTGFLLLLPGWRWLDQKGRRLARDCLVFGLPLLVLWIALAAWSEIGAQTRLVAAAFPVFTIAGSLGFYALASAPRKPLDLGFVVRAILAVTLLLEGIQALGETGRRQVIPYWLAAIDPNEFLFGNLGTHYSATQYLASLPAGSQIRLMWEPRSFYCPRTVRCVPDLLFDHWARPLRRGQAPDEVFAGWQRSGDSYLLLFTPGFEFVRAESRFDAEYSEFLAALARWMTPIWSDGAGGYTLYAWADPHHVWAVPDGATPHA